MSAFQHSQRHLGESKSSPKAKGAIFELAPISYGSSCLSPILFILHISIIKNLVAHAKLNRHATDTEKASHTEDPADT